MGRARDAKVVIEFLVENGLLDHVAYRSLVGLSIGAGRSGRGTADELRHRLVMVAMDDPVKK